MVDSLPKGMYALGVQSLDGTDRQRRYKYIGNGKAKFRFRIDTVSEVRILKIRLKPGLLRAERIICYTEPGSNISIKGESHENGISYRVTVGSKLNDEFIEAREYLYTFLESETQYEKIGLAKWKSDQDYAQELLNKSDSVRFSVIPNARAQFAKDHPNYEISSKYLLQNDLAKDTLYKYFDRIPMATRRTHYGSQLEKYIKALRSTSIGDIAPNLLLQQ